MKREDSRNDEYSTFKTKYLINLYFIQWKTEITKKITSVLINLEIGIIWFQLLGQLPISDESTATQNG